MVTTAAKKTLMAASVAVACSFGGGALASHIPGISFTAQIFTINPAAIGVVGPAFDAMFIDFSDQAEIDQTGFAFDETGAGFFGSFRDALGGPPDPGGQTFLTNANFYATFDGVGTTALNGAGGIDGTFTSFNVSLFVDPGKDTVCSFPTIGAPDGSTTCAPGTADIQVLTGILNVGGFHVFAGLANGDFDVSFDVTSFNNGFFGGPAFAGPTVQGDFNGVNLARNAAT